MIKRPQFLFIAIANLFIIGVFFYSTALADWLLSSYNILLVYLSFELSTTLCQQALQQAAQDNIFFVPNRVYRNVKILFLLCYVVSQISLQPSVSGFWAIAVGLLFMADLREFHYRELLKLPVMLFYALQAFGGITYLWLGYLQLSAQAPNAALYALFLLFSLPLSLFYLSNLRTTNPY
ncbi:hypothetical protein HYE66_00550 [Aggregatibacter actinomycetemcomitans]|nr:hypothetical protein [Aggregatibacter actinomycetemcomitans]